MTNLDTPSPLAGIAYGRRAHDLCRFVADPADAAIARIVRDAGTLVAGERDTLRAQIGAEDCYTLLTFARRSAASAIRGSSLAEAIDAVDALTLITRDRIDYRDLSVDFPLYAVKELGGDVGAVAKKAMVISEPGTSSAFGARRRWAAGLTLEDCALMEVVSRYGLGFMETWAHPYRPRANLAAIAVRIADTIDASGGYVVDDLHLSSLPRVWFEPDEKVSDVRVNGCVSISAWRDGTQWGDGLLVFLAEVSASTVAASLVARADAASTPDRPRVAASMGSVHLLVVGGSWTFGEATDATVASLSVLRDALVPDLRVAQ